MLRVAFLTACKATLAELIPSLSKSTYTVCYVISSLELVLKQCKQLMGTSKRLPWRWKPRRSDAFCWVSRPCEESGRWLYKNATRRNQLSQCQLHTRGRHGKKPTCLERMVDTEVKEDAEQIAVSLAILQHGPIDLIRSNNPLDCLGSPCLSGCYNPSDSRRCAQTHSGCLIPQHPVLRLFWRARICPRALSLLGGDNAVQTDFLAWRGHTGRVILNLGTVLS